MARKKGDITGSGANRRRWDGRRWVPAPVGSPARNTSTRTRAQNRRSSSRTTTPTKVKVPNHIGMTKGKTYGGDPNKDKPLTENQRLARSNRTMDRTPTKAPPTKTPPKTTPTKPAARAASASDAQDLRRGRTPATPSTPSTPPKKKYGVKDGNNAKGRTKRLKDALNNLKVRKY